MNGRNVAKFVHFRRMSDMLENADAGYVMSMSLVSNGVAMIALQYLMVHVVCLQCRGWESHRSGWEYRGFSMLKDSPPAHAI